jgi:two-component system, NarL family, nitrate/nitrite response regulator NarL
MPPDPVVEEPREAIIVIDDEPFSQECVIEALRGFFSHAMLIGIPSVEDLYRPDGTTVALVLMKARARSLAAEVLASDLRILARHVPKAPVVLISVQDDDGNVLAAMAAGVQGVVPVTASLRIGVAALQLVMAGGTYYPRPIPNHPPPPDGTGMNGQANGNATAHQAPDGMPAVPAAPAVNGTLPLSAANHGTYLSPTPPARNSSISFTARESEVLAALQLGRSNKWIANHLNLSQNTIKVHIRHIMRKLHATNRTEAVVLSRRFGLDLQGSVFALGFLLQYAFSYSEVL